MNSAPSSRVEPAAHWHRASAHVRLGLGLPDGDFLRRKEERRGLLAQQRLGLGLLALWRRLVPIGPPRRTVLLSTETLA
jgi:hypothetical protein